MLENKTNTKFEELKYPGGITFDSKNSRLFISDTGNNRIVEVTIDFSEGTRWRGEWCKRMKEWKSEGTMEWRSGGNKRESFFGGKASKWLKGWREGTKGREGEGGEDNFLQRKQLMLCFRSEGNKRESFWSKIWIYIRLIERWSSFVREFFCPTGTWRRRWTKVNVKTYCDVSRQFLKKNAPTWKFSEFSWMLFSF